MKKEVFTWEEAKIVAYTTPAATLKLQLHQWKKAGDIASLKRGVYFFPDREIDKIEIARQLYAPCYLSMECALNHYGFLPDVPFAMTMITTRPTRMFNTPVGQFTFQTIKKEAFFGFNPVTLMAQREKALVDYLYLNINRFLPEHRYWQEMRWQNMEGIHFGKALGHAKRFGSKKLIELVRSLKKYAKSH